MADIGSVLGGRYRLVELLGEGGMATIYRARDNQLERDVAVKVLRPEYGRDPDFFARFRQEAQSAASLNHQNVVAVYDYGTDEIGPFIVMELVDGEDLASIIRRGGALPPRQAARLAAEIARAIAAAHEHGFVHRDIKPGNVLVTRDGRVKVADFGIARAIAEAQLTLPGTTLGSVHYFSPEQARGETAGPASDIYSLGIVLYELVTGKRPFEGDTAAAIATARLTGPVPSPSAVRGGVPPSLEAIDRKALAPDPADRFASATAMAEALERYIAEERAAAVALQTRAVAAGDAPPAAAPSGAAPSGAAADAAPPPVAARSDAATVAAATARPNAGVPYADDAYAGSDDDAPPAGRLARRADEGPDEDGGGRTSPWLWVSAFLALAILAVAGYLAFRFLAGGPQPSPQQGVLVPSLIGRTFEQAEADAAAAGLEVVRFAFEPSDEADGTVLAQDPEAGATVERGSVIKLTLALGDETVTVPDLRGRTESEGLNLIAAAGLTIGSRTEEFDPLIPAGSIVSQDPGPGLVVTKGIDVNYIVSKGLEPTPTPTPSPTPSPTPAPTPTPTAAPTPTPTPGPRNVGDYRCKTLADATVAIAADGFILGVVSGPETGLVVAQAPAPGTSQPFGAAIDLTLEDPPTLFSCPPPGP